jgi:hypothetical protein
MADDVHVDTEFRPASTPQRVRDWFAKSLGVKQEAPGHHHAGAGNAGRKAMR